MLYSSKDIVQILGVSTLNKHLIPGNIKTVYFDTRKVNFAKDALFLAIDGKNSDGHKYISTAFNKQGARNFLVSKKIDISSFPDANFFLCNNVISAIQKLALYHRSQFKIPVVGITGSNGKTIVKEWIHQLLQGSFNIVRSPGSYNSQLGVPLSVLKIEQDHNLGIFEAGISTPREMEGLGRIVNASVGVFTNIGPAHSAGFESLEKKLDEKLLLFNDCQKIIYSIDDDLVHSRIQKTFKEKELISWSLTSSESVYNIHVDTSDKITSLVFTGKVSATFFIPFKDSISIKNAIIAIVTALEIGAPLSDIQNYSQGLRSIKMRLELKQGINNCLLINDSYNSDLNALNAALAFLSQQQAKDKNTLILSQIEESNLTKEDLQNKIAEILSNYNLDRVIAIGKELKGLEQKLNEKIQFSFFEQTEQLARKLEDLALKNENILIKGARKFNLEDIFTRLSTKVHQTILEIDLEAMRHNLSIFRSFLEKDTKLMVVLKASAYGSGSKELSRFLTFQRVDYIAVAYIDEGVELREAGITCPIMVMNPEESGFEQMVKYKLEPEIYSVDQLMSFKNYVEADQSYPIHLKIETGMHRLGIEEDDYDNIAAMLNSSKGLRVASIFSHLVGSDDPALDDFSFAQIKSFEVAYQAICSKLRYEPIRHILNSNGITRFPSHQYEMVRLGIGLHGITDDKNVIGMLEKVQSLKTRIAQIKKVKSGESIGYSRKYTTGNDMTIATINIGYADGLPRNAGNRKFSVLLNGKAADIVGNVCMDMCMIDISEINAEVGDEVEIFGKRWPIENLATACNTIPYEILTRLSSRIHRIFSRE